MSRNGRSDSRFQMPLSHIKQRFLAFLFEESCCLCNGLIDRNDRDDRNRRMAPTADSTANLQICEICLNEITGSLLDRCLFCGATLTFPNPFKDRCRGCRSWKSRLERAVSIGNYQGQLRETIIEIKRDLNDIKAIQLGEVLGSLFDKFDMPDNIDWAVPVPSHWRRRLSRKGLHVADVIADGFCRVTGIAKTNRLLQCNRFVKKQSTLQPAQRISNVRGVFAVNGKFPLRGIRVLLIDDVMTTGATISECARLFRKAGVSEVYAAVAARGMGTSQVPQ